MGRFGRPISSGIELGQVKMKGRPVLGVVDMPSSGPVPHLYTARTRVPLLVKE
jgi:hypothetical protein